MSKKAPAKEITATEKKPNENRTILAKLLNQKENEQSILLCVAARIAAARTRADLWNVINEDILGLFGGVYYTLCLLHEDRRFHSPFIHSKDEQFDVDNPGNPIIRNDHPVEDGIFDYALKSSGPVQFQMETLLKQPSLPVYIPYWAKMGIQEMLVVKITNGDEDRGVLYLYANKTGAFSQGQFGLLSGIADLIGTGICNILANEKIEEQIAEINRYKQQLEEEKAYLIAEQRAAEGFAELIGTSPEMQKVFSLISKVADSSTTVLLLGETGTGKELVARAIHEASPRNGNLMIKVNCAAMPASLIESELFGHEKGSFTGASERRIGKFELAHNSTLFLDEIGELPLELQAKILRALQEKEIERIGGKTTIKVDVRVIAATNRNLEKEVTQQRFRSDLYYRLNVFPITLPPLRKRKQDIPSLAAHFIERFARSNGKTIHGLSRKAMDKLEAYAWPGNIRELEHMIERTILLTNGHIIRNIQLPEKSSITLTGHNSEFQVRSLEEVEREYILTVLKHYNGRISGPHGAALKLQIPPTTLISRMQKLGIQKEHIVRSSAED
ncbi:sigma 54-interacting transcriptional regulator [Danxiaibacter flavus]|uniref:Sigma 54-interacting transcriptional regulator n=1 Tax=Danxiaibacter flavus TaxID=3049108 RepID=A0ABV3ZLL1_9BACT|nr:sigma 54-interacting transcriptional regulator [Chitinophagaceae bacterium DXS]